MQRLDIDTGKPITTYSGHTKPIDSIALSADGKLVVSTSTDMTTRAWSTETGQSLWVADHAKIAPLDFYRTMAFSPDGRLLAIGIQSNTSSSTTYRTILWDLASRREVLNLGETKDSVSAIEFSPDGKSLITAGGESVKLWEVATGRIRGALKRSGGRYSGSKAASFLPDGKRIATVSGGRGDGGDYYNAYAAIWDAETLQQLVALDAPQAA